MRICESFPLSPLLFFSCLLFLFHAIVLGELVNMCYIFVSLRALSFDTPLPFLLCCLISLFIHPCAESIAHS